MSTETVTFIRDGHSSSLTTPVYRLSLPLIVFLTILAKEKATGIKYCSERRGLSGPADMP